MLQFLQNIEIRKEFTTIPYVNEPILKRTFDPTLPPNRPKIGAKMKAVRFRIPKTKPYWLGRAPLLSASAG